jgi:hypothetical protein
MTERKLTPDQIEYLFTFVEQRDVKYYDVQMELIDHFASAIEKRWESNSGLSFEEAFSNEQRRFSRYDFSEIIEEKEKALQKKNRKIEHRYILDFFSWPKIVATSFVTLLIYQVFSLFINYFRFVNSVVIADFLLVAAFSFLVYPRKYKVDLNVNKEFLLLQHLKSGQHYFMSVGRLPATILMCLFIFTKDSEFTFIDHPAFKVIVAFLISLSVIFFFATGFYVPKRVKADFIREFPQFVKS